MNIPNARSWNQLTRSGLLATCCEKQKWMRRRSGKIMMTFFILLIFVKVSDIR